MDQIKQLFFDCDNTLVLTEYLAFETTADLVNGLLEDQGITDRYTSEQLICEFIGESFRGMMSGLQKKYNFRLTPEQFTSYVRKEEAAVIDLVRTHVQPCEGSLEVLEKLYNDKQYGLAVASSSALNRIRASLEKDGQDKFFPYDHVYSAATSLPVPTSKPNPAVYLHAMEQIGVKPENCVTVEDSKSGAVAAVRANIACIGYVGAYPSRHKQEQVAQTLREVGCKVIMYHWREYFGLLSQIESGL